MSLARGMHRLLCRPSDAVLGLSGPASRRCSDKEPTTRKEPVDDTHFDFRGFSFVAHSDDDRLGALGASSFYGRAVELRANP